MDVTISIHFQEVASEGYNSSSLMTQPPNAQVPMWHIPIKKKTPIFPAIIYYLVIDIIKVEFDGKSLGFQRDPVLGS